MDDTTPLGHAIPRFYIFLFMDSIEFERQSFLPKPLAFHEEHPWFSHEFPAAVGSMVMCQLVHFVAFFQGLASSSPLCPAICAHTWCDSGQVTAWKSCSASCWHCFLRPGAGECWLLGQKAKAEKREGVISGRKVRNGAWNGPSKSHRTSLGLTWDGYIYIYIHGYKCQSYDGRTIWTISLLSLSIYHWLPCLAQ